MTQEANKWQALVDELRAGAVNVDAVNEKLAWYGRNVADRIEALMAEICDVALMGCANPNVPEVGVTDEPCETHATIGSVSPLQTFYALWERIDEEGIVWGKFTKKETG
jgi:hypothetical protein